MRHIGFHEIDTIIYFSKSFLVIKQGVVLVNGTYREGSFLCQYLFMGRAFGVPLLSFTLVRRCVSMLCVCLCLWRSVQCVVCVFVSMAMCQCVRAHLCKSVQCVVCVFVSMAMCQCVRAHLCKSVQCVMCVSVSMGLCECIHVRIHVTVP